MSAVIFAAPYVPPKPPVKVSPWSRFSLIWHGVDGSVWPLNDRTNGVQLVDGGVTGLHFPDVEAQTSEYAGMDGQRLRGVRVLARTIDLPIFLWSDVSAVEWLERDRAFWRSFSPVVSGTLEVKDPAGVSRFISCRMSSDGGQAFETDPLQHGWMLYQLELIADAPYWAGAALSRAWEKTDSLPFFGEDNDWPPLHISNANQLSSATMSNPGDVAVWPIWTVTAGATDATVDLGVDGGHVVPPTVPAGQTLVIDTDPAVATAFRNGVDVQGAVDPWDPRPIPPGGSVPLSLSMTGTGTVSVSITPHYYRAY